MSPDGRISQALCHLGRFGLVLCVVWGCGGLAAQAVAQDVTQSQSAPSAQGGEETSIVDELSARLRKGEVQSAWELARANRRELEGEPSFDALYARAALNVGAYQGASFALERTLMLYPDYTGVRLTLVEAYLGMGNTQAASRQLQRLDQAELNDSQRARWQGLSQVRDQLVQRNQTRSSLFTSVQTFYNTNISGGLTCSSCEVAGESIPVAPESKSQAAPGASLQIHYDRTTPVSQRVSRNVQAGGQVRFSTYEDANGATLQVGFGHQRQALGRYDLLLSPSWNNDGLAWYGRATGRLFDLVKTVDGTLALSVNQSAGGSRMLTTNIAGTDSQDLGQGLLLNWQSGFLSGLGESEPDHYWGANAAVQLNFPAPNNWFLRGGLDYQLKRYFSREVGDGKLQSDRSKVINHSLGGQLSALKPLPREFQLSAGLSWQHISSNDPFMETGGVEVALGVQRAW